MNLTDKKIQTAKPRSSAYRLGDGHGLYLLVQPEPGGKLWRWKYSFEGKIKSMSFGPYPIVTLARARELHLEARRTLARGDNPVAERRTAKQTAATVNSFREVFIPWFEDIWSGAKDEQYARDVESFVRRDILPRIGDRPVAAIKTPEIASLVLAVQERGAADVARRVKQILGQFFEHATTTGVTEHNPATAFRPSTILRKRVEENFPFVEIPDAPVLLKKIELYPGSLFVRRALELMSPGELISAQWPEFDLSESLWSVPAKRMKMKRPHLVPLCTQALEILKELWERRRNDIWLFPGERANPHMSDNSMGAALEDMGYKGKQSPHGFRHLGSTILNEQGYNTKHVEMQLAHKPKDKVEGVYNKALYLADRRVMMQEFADSLEHARKTGEYAHLRRPRNSLRLVK
jgi:integrase